MQKLKAYAIIINSNKKCFILIGQSKENCGINFFNEIFKYAVLFFGVFQMACNYLIYGKFNDDEAYLKIYSENS